MGDLQHSFGNARLNRMLTAEPQEARSTPPNSHSPGRAVQRKCAYGGEAAKDAKCATCQEKRRTVQRGATGTVSDELPPSVSEALRSGGGQPLVATTRAPMEAALGADLSAVRVHTGPNVARAARDISAEAFTHGQDIFFADGHYQPHTSKGKRLLAHELTHTLQQDRGAGIQSTNVISQPSDPLEREAESVADRVAKGALGADGIAPTTINRKALVGANFLPASRGSIQRSWLDDVTAAAGDAYDAAASAASDAYDTVASTASGAYQEAKSVASDAYDSVSSAASQGATMVAEGVKAAASTVSNAGSAVGSYVSDAAETLSPDAEKTRTRLIGQVNSARQQAQAAGPDAVRADASQIALLNQQVSGLNAQLEDAAIPLVPVLTPAASGLGAALEGLLGAIAAALGISVGWLIVIIAVIVLAIVALVIYLLRDTKKYPEPVTDPKAEPKDETDPKKEPGPGPTVDPLPPRPDPRPLPDCCTGNFSPVPIKLSKHRRFGSRTITVHDGRGKHWRNVKPNGPGASCDVDYLAAVAGQNPTQYGPCLQAWIAAVPAADSDYGSQLGSDTAPLRAAIVKDIVENGEEINSSRYWGDAGFPVGVDISSGTGTVTTKARVDGLPNQAHVIPQEARPT
jgi:hypothetical protein